MTVKVKSRATGVFHDCATAGCAGSHEAFRCWLVSDSEELPLAGPYASRNSGVWKGFPAGALTAHCGAPGRPGHSAPEAGARFVAGFLSPSRQVTCQACGEPVDPEVFPGLCSDPG